MIRRHNCRGRARHSGEIPARTKRQGNYARLDLDLPARCGLYRKKMELMDGWWASFSASGARWALIKACHSATSIAASPLLAIRFSGRILRVTR